MRIGLICERKDDFPFLASDPEDIRSELLTHAEEDELTSGLRDAGHLVLVIRDAEGLLCQLPDVRKCDLVFNQSTGYRGTERMLYVPAILEAASIPYVGSTPYVHALLRNKDHTKLIMAKSGSRLRWRRSWQSPSARP